MPMAFRTLSTRREGTTLAALGERIAQLRDVAPTVDVPRNSGRRRTPSKRALLDAINDAGGEW